MKKILTLSTFGLSFFFIISSFKKNINLANTVDVGVVVSDLERSQDFYTNVLGRADRYLARIRRNVHILWYK